MNHRRRVNPMATVCYKHVTIETELHPAFPDYEEKVKENRVERINPPSDRYVNMERKAYTIKWEHIMPWFDKDALNNVNVESSFSKLTNQLANRKHNAKYIKEIAETVPRELVFKYETGLWRYED
jgi:hypothetical protein